MKKTVITISFFNIFTQSVDVAKLEFLTSKSEAQKILGEGFFDSEEGITIISIRELSRFELFLEKLFF